MTSKEVRNVLGYVRVSTSGQGDSGLGLEAQRAAIEAECERRGWQLLTVYTDVASGKTNGRRELQAALAELAAHRADALVATKVDRIARSMFGFANIAQDAHRQNWALVLVQGGFDMSTPYGKAMAGMSSVFAELEGDMISERTREAMAIAKARQKAHGPKPGKMLIGRPKLIAESLEDRIVHLRASGNTYEAIAAKLTAERVPTPTGRDIWSWTTVSRVVNRQ
jgi:DNA invertase Pin-like site-specific DNA recombinase